MDLADVVGGVAATLTTVSFIPQALQVIRTRETGAISLSMYTLFTAGVLLWGAFGVMTLQWSIIIANAVTLVLATLILGMKVQAVIRSRPKSDQTS